MGYKIVVKQGNIVEEKADFIVNASNTKLMLGSGVSMAFKRACGIELQKELDEILKKYKHLEQGDVVISSSGKADNFTYTLHAAIMNYNDGVKHHQKKPTISTIYKAIENIENILIRFKKSVKVAIPLMGCGIGGLDKQEVIKVYKEFFKRDIKEEITVAIYGFSEDDYKLIKKILKD